MINNYIQGGEEMREIIIDEQFKYLLPKLEEEIYRGLEASILGYGCLYPLVLWNGILIDGYNRYKICTEHDIPFDTIDMEFGTREEVVIWIIRNQIERRNLTPIQLSYFRGLHYNADKMIQGSNNQHVQESEKAQNEPFHLGSTATRLGEQYNVSRNTIKRDKKLADALTKIGKISPEAKRKILSGETAINKSKLEALASAPDEKTKTVATEIEAGTYNRRAARDSEQADADDIGRAMHAPTKELEHLGLIISDFAKSFDAMLREHSSGGSLALKSVLRSYIDELEELYRNMQ